MPWTTPKTDSAAGNAIPSTELNKIGDNLAFLESRMLDFANFRNNHSMFSDAYQNASSANIAAGADLDIFAIYMNVPAGGTLNLVRARGQNIGANLRLKIYVVLEDVSNHFVSTTNNFDTTVFPYAGVEKALYANATGSVAFKQVRVSIHNPTAGTVAQAAATISWECLLSIAPFSIT
jgi:hypothetical protein